eukprot:m.199986 g.199986  ORF g.199986 m.199986 type:complete len:119 (-) comp10661_c3_seq15:294-650(-)
MKSAHDAKSSLDASGRTVAPKSIVQGDESSVSGQSLANERVRVRMQKRSKKEAVSEKPKSLGWPCLHPQGDVAGPVARQCKKNVWACQRMCSVSTKLVVKLQYAAVIVQCLTVALGLK